MTEGRAGQPWASREVETALDAYFRMLRWQLEEREFVKADVRAQVSEALPARSKKSIELKWCNVSAVLAEMELPWLDGFRPLPHYQRSLREAVEHWLERNPEVRRLLER